MFQRCAIQTTLNGDVVVSPSGGRLQESMRASCTNYPSHVLTSRSSSLALCMHGGYWCYRSLHYISEKSRNTTRTRSQSTFWVNVPGGQTLHDSSLAQYKQSKERYYIVVAAGGGFSAYPTSTVRTDRDAHLCDCVPSVSCISSPCPMIQ